VRGSRLAVAILVLAGLLATGYVLAAIFGGLLIDWDDDGGDSDRWFWIVFMIVGAALLVGGLAAADRSRWLAAALISLGAVLGAVVIFWSVVVPIAAVVLVVLSVLWARRTAPTA
jgi:hypothetical protein